MPRRDTPIILSPSLHLQAQPPVRLRRDLMRWLALGAAGGVAPALLSACGGGSSNSGDPDTGADSGTGTDPGTGTGTDPGTGTGTTTCAAQPTETNGPYPADGTTASGQTLNALTLAGFVRSDIRSSVGGASGTASGVPFTLKLKVVNTNASCAALPGYAVYVWHCTKEGDYSMYSSGITGENYLRGVQVADGSGELEFTTIFPGCYAGRWPHIHFEVYATETVATTLPAGDWSLVSQMALPEDVCRSVYAQSGYGSSLTNLNRITLASDNVFRDGYSTQMMSVTGDATNGYTGTLTIGLAV
ncbi:MAG: intradiol ring-cleavage dioxygenase [Pseudomonadota bacterium]|nr:intradiol ring-cleavage dioxygenase [Pseudomonadota bacterium]